ncbi:MAG: 3-oxoacyl-ACP reductase family protein [Actinomycetota bacterium]
MPERAALVTGASRGIGRAIAVGLAGSGHGIAVNYRSTADEAKETLSLVEDAGGEGICVQGDVGESDQVDRFFSEIEEAIGPVGILVNNAGIRADGLLLGLKDDAWDRVLKTNLYGTFHCCRRALRPMLKQRWGRIVNVASVAGLRASPGQTNYSAAKAGVIGLTKALAAEVARRGITVNAITPGLIDTELTSDLKGDRLEDYIARIPQGKPGTPDDVAAMVDFLCSDRAAYVTGGVFVTDGGLTA